MEEKNELNDLFLGEENKSGGSKKLFLIIAGALLVFFVTIGIMKFVNSEEEKPKNTNATIAKAPVAPAGDQNASTIPNDEKLNEIVRKLQEDAKNQAMQTSPLDAGGNVSVPAAAPKATPVAVPAPVAAQKAPAPAPVATKPAVAPAQNTTPAPAPVVTTTPAPAPAVVATTGVPASKPQRAVAAQPVATTPTPKDVMAQTVSPAPAPGAPKPKPVAPKPKPAPKPVAAAPVAADTSVASASATQAPVASPGSHFVQVGYFDGQKNVDALVAKASAAGFKTTTKAAQVNGKSVTKIMVGPFNTKEEAKAELAKIRQQVKPDAFMAQ